MNSDIPNRIIRKMCDVRQKNRLISNENIYTYTYNNQENSCLLNIFQIIPILI